MRSTSTFIFYFGLLFASVPAVFGSIVLGRAAKIAVGASSYGLYSIAVDKYAARVVNRMKISSSSSTTDENSDNPEINVKALPSQLRTTIQKRSNVVTNPEDRRRWDKWLIAGNRQKVFPPSNNDTRISSGGEKRPALIQELCNKREFQFAYRSYANVEEANAICRPFYNWQWFKFMMVKPGRMRFSYADQEEAAEASAAGTSNRNTLAHVTNSEHFRLGLCVPLTIQWWGNISTRKGANNKDMYYIEWTKTQMRLSLLGGLKKVVKDNPAVCQKLSALPWGICAYDDGMIGFKRGDIGYLAYDSKFDGRKN